MSVNRSSTRNLFASILLMMMLAVPFAQASASEGFGEQTVAYVGDDGNIWMVEYPDGEPTQVTTDGFIFYRYHMNHEYYQNPAWSPDGELLAFASPFHTSGDSIHYWDGSTIYAIPGTGGCFNPLFSPDSERIYMTCELWLVSDETPDPDDPRLAKVTSVKLDGSDMREEVTGSMLEENGLSEYPIEDGFFASFADIDSTTGDFLFSTTSPDSNGYAWLSADGTLIPDSMVTIPNALELYAVIAHDDEKSVLAWWCSNDCGWALTNDRSIHFGVFNAEGELVHEYPGLESNMSYVGLDTHSGSDWVVVSVQIDEATSPYILASSPDGAIVIVALGKEPAVRPRAD